MVGKGVLRVRQGMLCGSLRRGTAPCAASCHAGMPPLPLPAGEFTHAFTALKTILATEGRRGIFAG